MSLFVVEGGIDVVEVEVGQGWFVLVVNDNQLFFEPTNIIYD